MATWADFVITHARYDADGTRIEAVKRWEDAGSTLTDPEEKSRWEVVVGLSLGVSYCTAYKNDAGDYVRGDDVGTVEVDGETFLRTDGNQIEQDNLGELPEF